MASSFRSKAFLFSNKGKHLRVEEEFTKHPSLSLIFFVFSRTFVSEGVKYGDCHAYNKELHL